MKFAEKLPDGTNRLLSWQTKMIKPPEASQVTLDAQTEADLTLVIEPAVVGQIPPGEYQIVAALDVPASSAHAPGIWTGQSESAPVKLTIQEKPPHLPAAEEEKESLQFADYSLALGDFAGAAKRAQAVLAVNPGSISADIALAEAKRAQGDLGGALESFKIALSECYRQHPKSSEPPTLLLSRISDLEEALQAPRGLDQH